MRTPVGVARQCLANDAAAALDEAVAVAKRRNHAQTTSLHVVSALLALPSSLLRDACTRCRNVAYSQRLQFRALELSVGVALDRVSSSKSAGDEPPVSNSLMAAIKRSQANQRRHPETFLMYQQQLNLNPDSPPSISAAKVELKHFVVSILDDPIVSRVFGDADFQTQEMKLMILCPPGVPRFLSTLSRPPPPPSLFSSSFPDCNQRKPTSNFPFLLDDGADGKAGGNTKRVSEILLKANRRNPLLVGASAGDAYTNFLDCLKNGETGIIPKGIERLSPFSLEIEVSEFVSGSLTEAATALKLKQIDETMKNHQGLGIVVHCGDLSPLVDSESLDLVSFVVSNLKNLLMNSCGRLWLIAFMAGDEAYKILLERVPSIETDWDLSVLPITSSAIGAFNSSLMKSFIPFGGFFSELGTTAINASQPSKLCDACRDKFEQELSQVQKGDSNPSFSLQIRESETGKRSHGFEVEEGKPVQDSRVAALGRKWGDFCQKLHSLDKSIRVAAKKFPISESGFRNLDLNEFQRSPVYRQTALVPLSCACSSSITTDLSLGRSNEFSDESWRRGNENPSSNHEKQMCAKELEGDWKALAEKVYWQRDAIRAVNRAVARWRFDGDKGCLWLTFLGPDKPGKRKTAALLSEILFGSSGNLVYHDLSMKDESLKPGRKLAVDCISEELRKHPSSVVFLENVDKADILVQDSLSLATKTGKFQDSYGRVISVQGTVFVLESSILNVSAVGGSVLKRKTVPNSEASRKRQRSHIDLNMPVGYGDNDGSSEEDSNSSSVLMWLEEVAERVDENVVFRAFDFDSRGHEVVREGRASDVEDLVVV